MEKVFGLSEAQKIAGRKKVSVPTIKAMLEILGIPNVVANQAKAAIDGCRAAIKTAMDKIAEAKSHGINETARISEAVAALNKELATVVANVTGVEAAQNGAIKLNEGQIAALEKLAKKFGQ